MVNQVICDRSVGHGSAWAAIAGSRTTRSHCRAGSAGEPCARARIRKAVSGATFPPAASSSTSSQGCHQAKQAGGIFTTPASHRCGWARDRRRASGKRWLSFVQRIVMHPADSTCRTSAIYVPPYQNKRASLRHGRLHRRGNASSLREPDSEPLQAFSPGPEAGSITMECPGRLSFVRQDSVTRPGHAQPRLTF